MFTQKLIFVVISMCAAGVVCGASYGVPAAWNAPPPSADRDRLLKQVRSSLRRTEDAVRVIQIQAYARYYGESYDAVAKKAVWHRRPVDIARLVATYDGLPRGKFRANVPYDHTLWVGGPTPIAADRYLVAYNGRFGTYLETYAGEPKNEQPFDHGKVTTGMPRIRRSVDAFSGWNMSVYGLTADLVAKYRVRFSAYIKPNQKWAWVRAKKEERHGRQYVQVTRVGDPWGKEVFLLDPRHGYSIARETSYGWLAKRTPTGGIFLVPGTQVSGYFVATNFTEPAPGVFYPGRLVIKTFDRRVKRFRRKAIIEVLKVTANNLNFSESRYVIRFPRGSIVTDEATGKRVQIGGTPKQQLREIERDVRKARKALDGAASTPPKR